MVTTFHIIILLEIFHLHSSTLFYVPYHAATCHSFLTLAMVPYHLPYFIDTLTIKNVCIHLPAQFPAVHVYRVPYVHTIINIWFLLCSSFYVPYLAAACHIPLRLVIFHSNPYHQQYLIYILTTVSCCASFPLYIYSHTTGYITYTFLLFILRSVYCYHLS